MSRSRKKGGKGTAGRFVMLTYHMMETEAWRALSAQERAVYLQLYKRFNGSNNGYLALSVRDAAAECNISKDTANKCFAELQAHGFIELVKQGAFAVKDRQASEWRLTHERCDRTGALPSRAFQKWKADAHG
jgi:Fic family protein